jgi:spermidine synthase
MLFNTSRCPAAEVALLPALYAATLFVGAALLFLAEPMVGKLLLPLVGGTPGVWNTCMVFFQIVLLAGYLYAHASTTRLGVRRQAVVHLVLLLLVVVALRVAVAAAGSPVALPTSLLPEDEDYPIAGLVAVLAVAVGVPFFVLSTTAPLLQRWFAATGHRSAKDPYFLYAASNAGSLLGLLAYPFLIEPRLTLADQQWAWAGGVVGYLVLVTACAILVRMKDEGGRMNEDKKPDLPPDDVIPHPSSFTLSTRSVARWVALAALPSSLLLAVTTHVSTDLAPVPLLWVVPLSLYLLSFILVFARWPDAVHRGVGRFTPMLLLFVVLSLVTGAAEPLGLVVGLHLAAFFGVCLVCHGELARDRPPPELLTAFYFWISLGGVLGGLMNALVAPVVFHRVGMVEYPLALLLAALVRPRSGESGNGLSLRTADVLLVVGLLGLAVGLVLAVPRFVSVPVEPNLPDAMLPRLLRSGLMFGLPAAAAFALVRRPARYALALGVLLVAGALDPGVLGQTLHTERNFFGVVRVTRSADGKFVRMVHGTTLHGQQRTDEPEHPRPMTYYHEKGPIGRVFATLPAERVRRVGAVGLGTGAVAFYARPGQEWTFYEIDPAVARIARDPRYFTFLSSCRAASCEIVLGDARQKLAKADDGRFDVLILDAFSSDAIPIHLLTREAVRLYVAKLAPGGVLAMHVSNVHLDLPPLVARLAADHDPPLVARYCRDLPSDAERDDGKTDSQWMILARSESDLAPILVTRPVGNSKPTIWDRVPLTDGPVWRDDFANLLGVWKKDEAD